VHALLQARPDVVVFDFPHAAVLGPVRFDTPAVMFTHNVEAEIFARHAQVATSFVTRWLWANQRRKMIRFEREALARFDCVVAVSDRDARHMQQVYGARNVRVINTGVDLDFFAWARPADGAEIMFSGSMDWLANQDGIAYFMDEVWPLITHVRPDARMTVVGRAPPKSLVGEVQARGLNWRFTGYVDDIRDFIKQASVYVIPLRVGGGTRLKVFEAMGLGCPVVSTTIGVEGLPLQHATHYLRADEPASFAQAVLQLLDDADLRLRLSQAARTHVEANFSFQSVAREFERICLDTIAAVSAAATQCSNPDVQVQHSSGR
jgi:glycosyltransferase involved in cell wall biosynthesis